MKADIKQAFYVLSNALCESSLSTAEYMESVEARGVILNHIEEQGAEIERLREVVRSETKSHAETAGFLQERKNQLATIRSALSAALGVDGSSTELAGLAGKVIPELAGWLNDITGTCPRDDEGIEMWPDCDTECAKNEPAKCWTRAAIEAAKGGE